ncbi:MAG: DUF4345 family protein [Ahrensia sp.]|nr:DUF4345 family protein [Ahrensia sp.]
MIDLQIVPPQTLGEMLAWGSAVITILFGLICFFAPRITFNILRLRTAEGVPEALSESRATMAGFYLGVGILAILLAQPFIWMVLGAGWFFTALGRLVSIIFDRGNTQFNWISIGMEAALAAGPLLYVFGYVG